MSLNLARAVDWVQTTMGEAHRGVLPHTGKLLAFGNRGTAEVRAFRQWLKKAGYEVAKYAADGGSWVMLVTPPARMRDTRAVLRALWDASPDSPDRKAYQLTIADSRVRLTFAQMGVELTRPWFTRGEVNRSWVVPTQPVEPQKPVAQKAATVISSRSWLYEPSLN